MFASSRRTRLIPSAERNVEPLQKPFGLETVCFSISVDESRHLRAVGTHLGTEPRIGPTKPGHRLPNERDRRRSLRAQDRSTTRNVCHA